MKENTMKSFHTKGPWLVRVSRNKIDREDGELDIMGPDDDPDYQPVIAEIPGIIHKMNTEGAREITANARLLAAAPSLYSALYKFVRWVESYDIEIDDNVMRYIRDALHEASKGKEGEKK